MSKRKKIASRKSQYFKGQAKKRKLMKAVDRENLKKHKGNELFGFNVRISRTQAAMPSNTTNKRTFGKQIIELNTSIVHNTKERISS